MIWIRYALVFLAVAVGVGQVVNWLNLTQDGSFGGAAQLMVPAMIAALIEGQQDARARKAHPGKAAAWRFAVIGAAVALGLNVALAYAGPALAPEFAKLAIAPAFSRQFLMLLGVYALGYLLCNRFFYGLGVSNQLTLMRRRDETE